LLLVGHIFSATAEKAFKGSAGADICLVYFKRKKINP